MDGTPTTACNGGWGCPLISWPGHMKTADGQSTLDGQPSSWFGSLLGNKTDGSGLQYMRNRYYDPNTGRFTQEDPIGLAGGMNLYGFAGGDPINFSEPFGLCVPWPSCALAAARAGAAVGTVAGAAVGGLFGGVGAAPGALIGNRAGWILVGGAATANAALLLLREGDQAGSSDAAPTADEIISAEKKASIRREFPGEMLGKTLEEIERIAKDRKSSEQDAARRAKKLLTNRRFDKEQ